MTNEELVAMVQAGTAINENMALLYNQMRRFIYKLAMAYQGIAEIDDLMQEGYIALRKAADLYDPSEGSKFINYAAYWINQGIGRYVDDCCRPVRIPVHAAAKIGRYKRLVREYTLHHGEPPPDDQIARYMHITPHQLAQLKKDMRMAEIASLDKPVGEDGEETEGDFVPGDTDTEAAALDHVERERLREALWSAVDSLPGDQSQIIRGRYQDGQTLEGLARMLGKSREHVRQDEHKALRKLRLPRMGLRPFAEEFISSHAYRHTGYEFFNRTWTSATEWTALKLIERT